MRCCTVIVNPKAGNGKALGLLSIVEAKLRERGYDVSTEYTRMVGDGTRIAQLVPHASTVVALGGDGTLNEIINGLPQGCLLAIVPGGSGNDLIKSLPIPNNPIQALAWALQGKPRKLDVGVISCGRIDENGQEVLETGERLFINGVGVGFDAAVAVRKGEIKYLTGTPVYLAAVLLTLGSYKAPLFEIQADGVSRSSKNLLIAIGNGRCAGGGFYLTPEADPADGKLDVCLIDDISIPTIFGLMPRVMLGRHLTHRNVTYTKTNEVKLRTESRFFIHADGEIVGHGVEFMRVKVRPQYVSVLGG